MASIYRKKKDIEYDRWHFCSYCSNWPTTNYLERNDEPEYDEICDECKDRQEMDNRL